MRLQLFILQLLLLYKSLLKIALSGASGLPFLRLKAVGSVWLCAVRSLRRGGEEERLAGKCFFFLYNSGLHAYVPKIKYILYPFLKLTLCRPEVSYTS